MKHIQKTLNTFQVHFIVMGKFQKLNTILFILFPNLEENTDTFDLLLEVNNKSERMWKFFFWWMFGVYMNTLSMIILPILYDWVFAEDFNVVNYYHPIKSMFVCHLD